MIIDGKSTAEELKVSLKREVEKREKKPTLAAFVVSDDFATQTFIKIKREVAKQIGIDFVVHHFSQDIEHSEFIEKVKYISKGHNGVVIQFPLPSHIDTDTARDIIPVSKDVDVISNKAFLGFQNGRGVFPPVVGAIKTIAIKHSVPIKGKRVVVVGEGRLVGKPSAVWARLEGGDIEVVNAQTKNIIDYTRRADILILGAGVPGLIKQDMIKEGVAIFDAGTSEANRKLSGDADPACAQKASLFTPVPGGIGPITVMMIFKNLLDLSK